MRCLLFIALLATGSAHATVYDLGVIGRTYDIAEPDMLQSFYRKLRKAEAEGKIAEVETHMKQRFIDHANRPKGVTLPRTETHRVRYYDPSIVLTKDIVDHEGNLLWPAGTAVNPLEYVSMSEQWLFFDGDDPEQTAWARDYLQRYPNRVRPILIQGAPLELSKVWNTRLYFDQHGTYVEKFGIETVPALISQEGKKLRIDEVVPHG